MGGTESDGKQFRPTMERDVDVVASNMLIMSCMCMDLTSISFLVIP